MTYKEVGFPIRFTFLGRGESASLLSQRNSGRYHSQENAAENFEEVDH